MSRHTKKKENVDVNEDERSRGRADAREPFERGERCDGRCPLVHGHRRLFPPLFSSRSVGVIHREVDTNASLPAVAAGTAE